MSTSVRDLQAELLLELRKREPDPRMIFRLRERIHAIDATAVLYWVHGDPRDRARFEKRKDPSRPRRRAGGDR